MSVKSCQAREDGAGESRVVVAAVRGVVSDRFGLVGSALQKPFVCSIQGSSANWAVGAASFSRSRADDDRPGCDSPDPTTTAAAIAGGQSPVTATHQVTGITSLI